MRDSTSWRANEIKALRDEVQFRMKARRDLLTFATEIDIPGVPATGHSETATVDADPDNVKTFAKIPTPFAAHHRVWLQALQRVADGSIKRLMGLYASWQCEGPGARYADP